MKDFLKGAIVFGFLLLLHYFNVYTTILNETYLEDLLSSGHFYNGAKRHSEIFQLATINLTDAEKSEKDFLRVAQDLTHAFKHVGFAYVSGCQNFKPDLLHAWTKWFFNLSIDVKMKLAKKSFQRENPNVYRGYLPIIPGGHSYKEGLEIGVFNNKNVTGRHLTADEVANQTENPQGRKYMRNILAENNVWPVTADPESDMKFQHLLREQHKAIHQVGETLTQLMAVGLGFGQHHFDHLFLPKNMATLRLIHYPSRLDKPDQIPEEAWDGEQAIVTGEHQDSSILTILSTFENRGLQIKPPGYKQWIDVPVEKDKLVINIGALLQQLVEDRMIATNHRVLDIGTDRYSAAMFYGFHYDGSIEKTFFGNENKIAGAIKKYGPWVTNRTSMFVESKTTDFGVDDDNE